MNERIRELAEQASKLSRQKHPELEQGVTLNDILGNTERKVYVVDEVTTQKFAELIIRECMSMCDETQANYLKHRKATMDFDEKNIFAEGEAASDVIKHKMKKRFGVE